MTTVQDSLTEDDRESLQDDFINSSFGKKERLESLMNLELKHSGVYNNLHSQNNLMKLDSEKFHDSFGIFASQMNKTNEVIEENHEKISEHKMHYKNELKQKTSIVMKKLEETKLIFCNALSNYGFEVLKQTINFLHISKKDEELSSEQISEQLIPYQIKLINCKSSLHSPNLNNVTKSLFDSSVKHPQIEKERARSELIDEIKRLEQKRQKLRSAKTMNKSN